MNESAINVILFLNINLNKKKLTALITAITLSIGLLSGCGDSGSALSKSSTITLSQYLNSGNTIWYNCGSVLEKDSKPGIWLLTPEGDLYTASSEELGYTLGDLSKMTDDEIEDLVYNNYKYKGTYNLKLETDGTGNSVESEVIHNDISAINNIKQLVSTAPQQQVYDSFYNGYYYKFNGHDCFYVTRTDADVKFVFDEIGTDGIEVD